jgi:hypothetical protein
MDVENSWVEFFRNWPASLGKRGVVAVSQGDPIPFSSFAAGKRLIVFDRQMPDTAGARHVVVQYDQISALKIIDVVKPNIWKEFGVVEGAGP